ncbi:MAG: fumarylacetoacetate hydrolase family protein [Muribaculaceae bacterium]|nr:fumarylacetoacetate hydrolase family protein [Muribaculaceae bacterium]
MAAYPQGYPGSEASVGGYEVCMMGDVSSVPHHHPFFIPDFASEFEALPAVCVRIGRVGKSIPLRFARRYVGAVAPALLMVAVDLLDDLRRKGAPWTQAVVFDASAPCGEWKPCAEGAGAPDILFSVSGTDANPAGDEASSDEAARISGDEITDRACRLIASLSRTITLKTGDLFYMAIAAKGIPLRRGMRISAFSDSSPSLLTRIR